jgi:hypothetical protein
VEARAVTADWLLLFISAMIFSLLPTLQSEIAFTFLSGGFEVLSAVTIFRNVKSLYSDDRYRMYRNKRLAKSLNATVRDLCCATN